MITIQDGFNKISSLGPEEVKSFREEKLADEIEKENAGDDNKLEEELSGSEGYKTN